jgi:hypothetical protein
VTDGGFVLPELKLETRLSGNYTSSVTTTLSLHTIPITIICFVILMLGCVPGCCNIATLIFRVQALLRQFGAIYDSALALDHSTADIPMDFLTIKASSYIIVALAVPGTSANPPPTQQGRTHPAHTSIRALEGQTPSLFHCVSKFRLIHQVWFPL